MALTPGTRLGPYEILTPLGAGGMGEVYRAKDTRLDRTVALKVLPPDLASDPTFRARFDREARAISQLQHPHICTLYDVGDANGTAYLVMELLQGQTLADRLKKGALPIAEALGIAIAIADALAAAHRQGIVHRDLKPGNIMLVKTGTGSSAVPHAKLLDFGLAKASVAPVAAGRSRLAGGTDVTTSVLPYPVSPGAGDRPEVSSATHITGAGVIVGTLHYMAPEQVEGREADGRSDIWALGAVLYEMLTGTMAFSGDSSAAVVGSILKDRPLPLSARRAEVSPLVDHLVARCLEKDPDERWQTVADVRRELAWMSSAGHAASADPSPVTARGKSAMPQRAAAGLAMVAVAALLATEFVARRDASTNAPLRKTVLAIAPPSNVQMVGSSALSPDGRSLVFVGIGGDEPPSLWLYSLDSGATRPLQGTGDALYPFWSPRSDAVGFFARGQLQVVGLAGAAPRSLAQALAPRGGSWSRSGTIIYTADANGPVFHIPADGGTPTMVRPVDTAHGDVGHRWPTFVDDEHFLFAVQSGRPDSTGLYVSTLDGAVPPVRLTPTFSNALFVNGRVLFVENGMVVARTLDVAAATFTSPPVQIAGPANYAPGYGYSALSFSEDGLLAYPAPTSVPLGTLHWVDRQGRDLGRVAAASDVAALTSFSPRFSPDGRKIVVNSFATATADIWLIDVERDVASRLTVDPATDQYPTFAPNGTEVLFGSNRTGFFGIYRKPSNNAAAENLFFKSSGNVYPTDWSTDGKTIVFTRVDPDTHADIWTMPATGGGQPVAVVTSPANEVGGRLSMDGRWLAYTSDESGRSEVYAQRLVGGSDKVQVSTQGGSEPQWSADGRELFYVAANRRLMSVPVSAGATLIAGPSTQLFDVLVDTTLGAFGHVHYAPAPDGRRFVLNPLSRSAPLMVIQHWEPGAVAR